MRTLGAKTSKRLPKGMLADLDSDELLGIDGD
jgi:hypothetical protein